MITRIIKSFLIFIILGTTLVFVGIPVDKATVQNSPNSEKEWFNESLALISVLSIIGVAAYIIIKLLVVVLDLDLSTKWNEENYTNPRTRYLVKG
ncbi:MAG: hypothetical protein INQ03_25470 [Candidatus Heimdallarchaeota archaeon]|nr:hypothetical protein [Candidatus Heimdallarchaeota archaeon]